MANGLDIMIRRIRSLPRALERVAPSVAAEVERVAKAELAAGHGIGGASWKATKAGNAPLQGAPDAIEVKAVGTVIVMRISDAKWWYKFHQSGTKKLPVRQVLPTTIPASITNAIQKRLGEIAHQTLGGGNG